jgi:glycosyltransferase involved in cell wall biosynthesis
MVYFINDVLPLVRSSRPEVVLRVVGANMPKAILDLAGPGVELLGWVEDLAPLYTQTRVVVAPLRYGAGIKGKIGEAAMYGVPFVCTDIAAEGTNIRSGHDCVIAEDANSFAAGVLSLLSDDELWMTYSKNSQVALLSQTSPSVARANLEAMFALAGVPARITR